MKNFEEFINESHEIKNSYTKEEVISIIKDFCGYFQGTINDDRGIFKVEQWFNNPDKYPFRNL